MCLRPLNEKDCISAKELLKIVYNKLSQPSGLLLEGLDLEGTFTEVPFLGHVEKDSGRKW